MNVPSNIKQYAEELIKPQIQVMETKAIEDQQEALIALLQYIKADEVK